MMKLLLDWYARDLWSIARVFDF